VAVTTGATAGAILLTAPTSVIVGASATATTVLAVVRPLHFAALPRLARGPDQLVSANATSSMSDAFALFAGPVIAGLVTATAGPWLVVVGSTAASAVATLLCLRLRLGAPPSRSEESVGAVPAPRSRLAMTRDPGSLTLVLVMSTGFLIGGALDVLAVAYSENVLGRGEAGAGLLVGSIGIGAFVGAMIAGRLSHGRRLAPIVVLGGVVQGLAVALVAGVGSTSAAVAAIALTGAGGAFLSVAGRTLLQRAMDDALLARVFAFLESASLLGFAAGAAVAPTLITMFSAAGAFVPLGLTVAVVTTVVALPILRLDLRVAVALDPRPTSEDVAVSGTATSPGPLAR
jgi:hypothetical protein